MTGVGAVSRSALATACLVLCAGSLAGQDGRVPKVLLIGIDGVRPDVLAAVDTPNIDALIASGAFGDRARTTRPTISGPAWSSMLIGVWPEKHGVRSNNFEGNRYAEYPDFLTRIEQVRPELDTFAAADWLPLVTGDSGGPLISGAVDRVFFRDGYQVGWAEGDSMSVAAAVEALGTSDPDAMFVYLGNPDETSHQTGSLGVEYREAIALSDRHVGELVEALRARASYPSEDWLILVSTDPWRREDGGHGGRSPQETTIFVLAHGAAVAAGALPGTPEIVDIAVTALTHLGIPIDPAWELDGRAITLDSRGR